MLWQYMQARISHRPSEQRRYTRLRSLSYVLSRLITPKQKAVHPLLLFTIARPFVAAMLLRCRTLVSLASSFTPPVSAFSTRRTVDVILMKDAKFARPFTSLYCSVITARFGFAVI
jgi:hypothetical protein